MSCALCAISVFECVNIFLVACTVLSTVPWTRYPSQTSLIPGEKVLPSVSTARTTVLRKTFLEAGKYEHDAIQASGWVPLPRLYSSRLITIDATQNSNRHSNKHMVLQVSNEAKLVFMRTRAIRKFIEKAVLLKDLAGLVLSCLCHRSCVVSGKLWKSGLSHARNFPKRLSGNCDTVLR
jgi:hypothetical protein